KISSVRPMRSGLPRRARRPTPLRRHPILARAISRGRISAHYTSVERSDGGKLRCTGVTWSDAVVIFPGEFLAFQNIERQAHALRAPAPGEAAEPPAAAPDFGEDDFEGEE